MDKIIHLDGTELKRELKELVRGSVEETLNRLLDEEADRITQASRYERSPDRVDTRAGHYSRKLLTTSGEVELKVPKLRKLPLRCSPALPGGSLSHQLFLPILQVSLIIRHYLPEQIVRYVTHKHFLTQPFARVLDKHDAGVRIAQGFSRAVFSFLRS